MVPGPPSPRAPSSPRLPPAGPTEGAGLLEGADPTGGAEPTEGAEPTTGAGPTKGAELTMGTEPTEGVECALEDAFGDQGRLRRLERHPSRAPLALEKVFEGAHFKFREGPGPSVPPLAAPLRARHTIYF